jgi:hypothetical protein
MNTAKDINIVIIEFFAAGAYIHRIVMGSREITSFQGPAYLIVTDLAAADETSVR